MAFWFSHLPVSISPYIVFIKKRRKKNVGKETRVLTFTLQTNDHLIWCFAVCSLSIDFISLQTNPFDLFETFFGPTMGGFAGMDSAGFGTRRRSTVTKGEDLRWVRFGSNKFCIYCKSSIPNSLRRGKKSLAIVYWVMNMWVHMLFSTSSLCGLWFACKIEIGL